jgi:hypothetical protein
MCGALAPHEKIEKPSDRTRKTEVHTRPDAQGLPAEGQPVSPDRSTVAAAMRLGGPSPIVAIPKN